MGVKSITKLLILFGVFIAALSNVFLVFAQQEGFSDLFNDSALPGWEHSETATVSGGLLRLSANGFAFKPGEWDDFTLTLKARFFNEGKLVVEYRVSDDGSYMLEITKTTLALKRKVGTESAPLGREVSVKYEGKWLEIVIDVEGGMQSVSVNDENLLSVHESDPNPDGGILLRVEDELRAEISEVALSPHAPEKQAVTPSLDTSDVTPAYEAESWLRLGGPPGGLGYDIRMRPDNPDIMFVTDANAGIHRSIDGGLTWEACNEGIHLYLAGGAPVFCATIDPHEYDIVWIGTQNLGYVFRSTDNGETWQERDAGIEHEGRSVRGITTDPNDPNVVYIGVEVASIIWNGEQIIKRFDLTQGEVYKSTDQGKTWKRIWVGDNLARYVWVDPRDSDRLYVSTGIFDRDAANSDVPNGVWGGVGILRSRDGGQTWAVLDEKNGLGGRYIPSLFMHPEDPDILLAGVTNTSDQPGAFVTYDGGDTWQLVLATPPGFGAQAVEIAESDPDIWYVASEGMIWRSDDAGQNWQKYQIGAGLRIAGLPIDLQVDPRDPLRIFVNNYGGGNFLSEDGGETWVDASHGYTGIGDLQNVFVTQQNDMRVFARNFRSDDGGLTWQSIEFDFTAALQLTQKITEPNIFIAGDGTGHIRKSEDDGLTWSIPYTVVDIQDGMANGSLDLEAYPMSALVSSPSDPQVIYSGFVRSKCIARFWYECFKVTPGLYRSDDGGSNWQQLEIPTGDISIFGITVDFNDAQHVLVGTADGLYESKNGGETWIRNTALDELTESIYIHPEKSQNNMQPSIILDVKIDPFDSNIIYVSSTPGGVYRSQDGGQTWEHMPAGMDPNETIYSLLPDPNRQGVVYASSAFSGVFVSEDGAQTWRKINDGLTFTNVRGITLSADGSVLYAGAEGGGVFRLGELKDLLE